MQENALVGIYCRLSVEDNQLTDSISIENQKEILTEYTKKQGWEIGNYYIDDGYSGTNFDRPGFKKMLFDIDIGKINTIITKDLSRLGREYIQTGYYIDSYFPNHNVRYIAVNDNIDTKNNYDDFIPFKNILNEMYAKDCSRKIRFTLENNIKNGMDSKTSMPLYGYMYQSDKRIKNPETAPVVSLIFDLFLKGESYSSISKILEEKKILSPLYYNYFKYNYGINRIKQSKYGIYHWNKQTIANIITNDAYIGVLRRGKTIHKFKSKKKIYIPKDKQSMFIDKFEAIIDKDIFELAQHQALNIASMHRNKTINKYSSIAYCMICGKTLRYKSDKRVNQKNYIRLTCRTPKCRVSITFNELDKYVKNEILSLKYLILNNKDILINYAKSLNSNKIKNDLTLSIDYYYEAKKYIEILENINETNCIERRNIIKIINKIYITKNEDSYLNIQFNYGNFKKIINRIL